LSEESLRSSGALKKQKQTKTNQISKQASPSVSTAPGSVSNLSIKQLQRRLEKAGDRILDLTEDNSRLKQKLSREISVSRSISSQLLQHEFENG